MRKNIYIILSLLFFMTSCDNWFDVTSSSEIRQKDHYKNVQGFQQSLIGCYIAMSENNLYGKTLSWHALEIMSHQYESSTNSLLNDLFHHNYKSQEVISVSEQIWSGLYNVIANANDALNNLEMRKEKLNPIDYSVLKGEFLAIRAYTHFDLLRLYGYGNWSNRAAELNAKLTIPYVTLLKKDITPQSTGADVVSYILKDLDEAATLLFENDPITEKKSNEEYAKINVDKFYNYRNLHLNYYAVRALQARVYQWVGTPEAMDKALEAASNVIKFVEAGGYEDPKYTFNTEVKFIDSNSLNSSNHSLSTEALFALNVNKLEDRISQYIVPDFQSENVYAFRILPLRVEDIYEKSNLDVRFSKLLQQNLISAGKGYVPVKLHQRDLSPANKNRISLIRIPEVYYIAAEAYLTKGQTEESLKLINIVREKRGLFTPLADLNVEETKKEIRKEYLKEYLGEGAMFFQYKRWGQKEIPNLEENETMGDEQYVIPYPDFEIQSGRKQ